MAEKEYIVSLKRDVDASNFKAEMTQSSGDANIPARSVDVANERLLSTRNTHYSLTDEEAQQLTNESNIFNAGNKILKMGPKKVIIKKGEHGSIYLDSFHKYILPACPVDSLVDPTGAGDSYAGGIALSLIHI